MEISIILGHPYNKSFNHALYQRIIQTLERNGHSIYAHDLYRENFDPVIKANEIISDRSIDPLVKEYTKELIISDGIIFVHPNWWGQPPAILKGYIDRVLRPAVAYQFAENDEAGIPEGLLKGKTGLVFNTSDTKEERENDLFHDPLDNIWNKCVFEFCGITNHYRKVFRTIADSSEEQRTEWLEETKGIINRFFPVQQG